MALPKISDLLFDLFFFNDARRWIKTALMQMTGLEKSTSANVHLAFELVATFCVIVLTLALLGSLMLLLMVIAEG
jgi:hypothetical protein